jgi:hypothetical protein
MLQPWDSSSRCVEGGRDRVACKLQGASAGVGAAPAEGVSRGIRRARSLQ